jgi:hypothetical protein
MPTSNGVLLITVQPEILISYSHHFVMLHSMKRLPEQKLQMFCRLCCCHLTRLLSARLLPQVTENWVVSSAVFFISDFMKIGQLFEVSIWRNKYRYVDLLSLHFLRRKVAQKYKVMLPSYWKVYRKLIWIHYLHSDCIQSLVLSFPSFIDMNGS